MEFRRVPSLPPYVFAVTEQLKLELRRAGEDVIDLGFGNPDLASPPAVGREAGRGGREAAQPPLLGESRHPEAAQRDLRPVPGPLRRRARSRDAGGRHDRRQGRARASDVGARAAGRRGGRARAGVSDPSLRARPGGRERDPGRARREQRGSLRPAGRCVRALASAPARADRVVPPQPDDAGGRPRLHGAARGAGA